MPSMIVWGAIFSLILVFFITKQNVAATWVDPFCGSRKTTTPDTVSSSNLQAVLSSLRLNASNVGFYNYSFGQEPDTVYGLYLCRGDVSLSLCRECIANASSDVLQLCPNSSEAILWYEQCMLRYSYRNFFGVLETRPYKYTFNISILETEDVLATNFLQRLIESVGQSKSMFVQDSFNGTGNKMWYGIVQCTRDLSLDNCTQCLNILLDYSKLCCKEKYIGYRIWCPSCNLRYENFPFWLEQPPPPPPVLTIQPMKGSRKSRSSTTIIIVSTSAGFSVFLLLLCGFIYRKTQMSGKKKGKNGSNHDVLRQEMGIEFWGDGIPVEESRNLDLPMIPISIIRLTTCNFSDEYKLGEGGFGAVYKGELPDGKQVAIKRLSKVSSQGTEEFKNEVILIAKLQHRNLVRLLGCCIEENEKLLVYEYMPNGSLALHLFATEIRVELDWKLRVSIINGIAKGIVYLHEDSRLRIIHRDLKTSNILLDHQMNPRISDFGMARIFGGDQQQANTNRVVGTYGYMAPEYAMHGIFSVKSDVFSFGVLLLEIIAGKRNGGLYFSEHGQSLLTHAWNLLNEGKAMGIMDSILKNTCVVSEVLKCIHIALLCVQEDAIDRPTMSTVVVMLASDTMILPKPKQPAFSAGRMVQTQVSAGSNCSVNDMTISNLPPR